MRRIALLPLLVVAAFALAACNSAATNAPTAGGSGAPAASEGVCATAEAGATAAVSVEIVDFAYSPEPVTAKVGDVVGWTNGDDAPHTATLDDGSCSTDNIESGATGLLVFNEAGTYTYHCNVHPTQMKDFTIEITE
jgi:plastocyanin